MLLRFVGWDGLDGGGRGFDAVINDCQLGEHQKGSEMDDNLKL